MIDNIFTVDQYQSKMGNDEDTVVLRFRAADKEPAIDLMEFVEKGYPFVLDADKSSGEEKDGHYSVFVEIQRTKDCATNVRQLLNGLKELCEIDSWRFRWYKDSEGHVFDEQTFEEVVPLTPEDYINRTKEFEEEEISEFFDQGAIDEVTVAEDKTITFRKPFAESLKAKFIALGDYDVLKHVLQGPIQLDESSRNQVVFLEKYLGNYDIHKISNHFLIRNGKRAIILSKDRW